MIIGIVGVEEKKLTNETKQQAYKIIRELLAKPGVKGVSSGHCHLGGIDIMAEEVGIELGLELYIYPPYAHTWHHYKNRNMMIAKKSNEIYCITIKEYPPEYNDMKFDLCYHCKVTTHVKSGGCWTTKYARSLGKIGKTLVI